jgi:hypothetical protein
MARNPFDPGILGTLGSIARARSIAQEIIEEEDDQIPSFRSLEQQIAERRSRRRSTSGFRATEQRRMLEARDEAVALYNSALAELDRSRRAREPRGDLIRQLGSRIGQDGPQLGNVAGNRMVPSSITNLAQIPTQELLSLSDEFRRSTDERERQRIRARVVRVFEESKQAGVDIDPLTLEQVFDNVFALGGESALASLLPGGRPAPTGPLGLFQAAVEGLFVGPAAVARGPGSIIRGVTGGFGAARAGESVATGAARGFKVGQQTMLPFTRQALGGAKRVVFAPPAVRTYTIEGGRSVTIPASKSRFTRPIEKAIDQLRASPVSNIPGFKSTEQQFAKISERQAKQAGKVEASLGAALRQVGRRLSGEEQQALIMVGEGMSPEVLIAHHTAQRDHFVGQANRLKAVGEKKAARRAEEQALFHEVQRRDTELAAPFVRQVDPLAPEKDLIRGIREEEGLLVGHRIGAGGFLELESVVLESGTRTAAIWGREKTWAAGFQLMPGAIERGQPLIDDLIGLPGYRAYHNAIVRGLKTGFGDRDIPVYRLMSKEEYDLWLSGRGPGRHTSWSVDPESSVRIRNLEHALPDSVLVRTTINPGKSPGDITAMGNFGQRELILDSSKLATPELITGRASIELTEQASPRLRESLRVLDLPSQSRERLIRDLRLVGESALLSRIQSPGRVVLGARFLSGGDTRKVARRVGQVFESVTTRTRGLEKRALRGSVGDGTESVLKQGDVARTELRNEIETINRLRGSIDDDIAGLSDELRRLTGQEDIDPAKIVPFEKEDLAQVNSERLARIVRNQNDLADSVELASSFEGVAATAPRSLDEQIRLSQEFLGQLDNTRSALDNAATFIDLVDGGGRIVGQEQFNLGKFYIPAVEGIPSTTIRTMRAYMGARMFPSRVIGFPGLKDPSLTKTYQGKSVLSGARRTDVTNLIAESQGKMARIYSIARLRKALIPEDPEIIRQLSVLPEQPHTHRPIKLDPSQALDPRVSRALKRADERASIENIDEILDGEIDAAIREMFPSEEEARALINAGVQDDNIIWLPRDAIRESGMLESKQANQAAREGWATLSKSGREAQLAKAAGGFLIDGVNLINKAVVLFLNFPAYPMVQLTGNTIMNLSQQGVFYAPNAIKSAFMSSWGIAPENIIRIKASVGPGFTTAANEFAPFGLRGVTNRAGDLIARFVDSVPRQMSWIHEARRQGYRTSDEVNALWAGDTEKIAHILKGADPEDHLDQIADRAKRAVVDFDRLSWVERDILTRAIWFYPWFRGAVDFTARSAFDRPFQSAAIGFGILKQQELANEKLGEDRPEFLRFAVPVGETKEGFPLVFSLNQALTHISAIEVGASLANLAFGSGLKGWPDAVDRLTPLVTGGFEALAGRDIETGRAIEGNLLDRLQGSFEQTLTPPTLTTIQRLLEPEEVFEERRGGSQVPRSKFQEAQRRTGGTLAPFPVNPAEFLARQRAPTTDERIESLVEVYEELSGGRSQSDEVRTMLLLQDDISTRRSDLKDELRKKSGATTLAEVPDRQEREIDIQVYRDVLLEHQPQFQAEVDAAVRQINAVSDDAEHKDLTSKFVAAVKSELALDEFEAFQRLDEFSGAHDLARARFQERLKAGG